MLLKFSQLVTEHCVHACMHAYTYEPVTVHIHDSNWLLYCNSVIINSCIICFCRNMVMYWTLGCLYFMIDIHTVKKLWFYTFVPKYEIFLQIQSVSDCFWQGRLLKMDTTWIPSAKIPALMPESLWHWSLCLIWTVALSTFMRELDIWKSHGESPRLYGGWSNTLSICSAVTWTE